MKYCFLILRYINRCFFLLMIIILPFTSLSSQNKFQQVQDIKLKSDLLFNRYSEIDEFSYNQIRSLYQDSFGFIWVGTLNGIVRFDGVDVERFVAGNLITDICEDLDGNIWIGTNTGLSCYNYSSNEITNYFNNPLDSTSLVSNYILSLSFADNRLWIGTKNGLSIFDIKKKSFQSITQEPFNKSVEAIHNPGDGYLWISTETGVVHYKLETDKYRFYFFVIDPNAFGDFIWDLVECDKDLYIATGGNGLLKLNYNHQHARYDEFERISILDQQGKLLSADIEIFDLVEDENKVLWLATREGLAMSSHISSQQISINMLTNSAENPKSISSNLVYKLLIDTKNVLWCGTDIGLNSTTVAYSSINNITFENFQLKNGIRSIWTKNGEDIWLGTNNDGILRCNLKTNSTKLFLLKNDEDWGNANRALYGADNKLYSGTLDGIWEIVNQSASPVFTSFLKGHSIYDILKTTRNEFIIGTNKGLYTWNKSGDFNKLNITDDSNDQFIRIIFEDKKGNLWVGTGLNGLFFRKNNSNSFIKVSDFVEGEEGIIGSVVLCICEYPENVIWVGTNVGLNRVEQHFRDDSKGIFKIKAYTEENGFPSQSIHGIIPDKNGNLWITSKSSLQRFNIADEIFQNMLTNIGFVARSYFKYDEDKLFFGHKNGFVLINPNKLVDDEILPKVYISNIKILNKDVEIGEKYNNQVILSKSPFLTDEITLNYRNNIVTFDYTALHLTDPEKVQFAYKLEGFDNQFSVVGSGNRSVTYTNLNAGTYNLKIKAANSYGKWSETPASMKIVVLPPPWKTWWAITIYILIISSLIFIFTRLSILHSKQQNQLKLQQQEKDQLNQLNDMKLKFFTDISHELRTPITLINAPVSDLLNTKELDDNVRSKIEMIKRNSKRLLHLIEELMMFRKVENGMIDFEPGCWNLTDYLAEVTDSFKDVAAKNDIELIFHTDCDPVIAYVDINKIEIIITNLLLNAVKYSNKKGHIIVSISTISSKEKEIKKKGTNENWIKIDVKDNGQGISENDLERIFERFYQSNKTNPGTGIGLSLAQSLVEMHNGYITVESKPNIETVFSVFLPVNNKQSEVNQLITVKNKSTLLYEKFDPEDLVSPVSHLVKDKEKEIDKTSLPSLLVVEDNVEVQEYLAALFSKDYKVWKADNGIEALESVRKSEPNVIVSDIMMPEMDGLELCKKIKNDINTCHIPVLLLTAKADVSDNIKGVETGADDYVAKPFSPELLLARVASLIENRRRIIEKFNSGEGFIPASVTKNPLDEAWLGKIMTIINNNIDNEAFSVEELGQSIGMSRSNLFRKLKAITGKTPIEFIYFIRLKRGMELLLERKLSVSQIAYEVGFGNPSSFSKSFKKQFRKSPSDFLANIINSKTDLTQ